MIAGAILRRFLNTYESALQEIILIIKLIYSYLLSGCARTEASSSLGFIWCNRKSCSSAYVHAIWYLSLTLTCNVLHSSLEASIG